MVRLSQGVIKIMGRDMDNLQKWRKDNLVSLSIRLNKANDNDVIEQLNKQNNKRAYIIKLIREDIKNEAD